MPKIHKDKHGLYAKVGGYIWRPVFPVGYQHVYKDGSEFQEGQTVKGRHTGGPLLNLKDDEGRKETWYSHGAYMGMSGGTTCPSEHRFKPNYENW